MLLSVIVGGCTIPSAFAVQRDNPGGGKSFQEFRKGMLSNFQSFRDRLLSQYADFLNGEWHEYESLQGEVRDNTPKPKTAPSINQEEPKPQPHKPILTPEPQEPAQDIRKSDEDTDVDKFSFYGLPLSVPKVDYSIRQKLYSPKDYAANWNSLKEADVVKAISRELQDLSEEMNLNDYLLFRLIESYVNNKFAGIDASSRFSLIHYILVNMGYDARIAVSTSGVPLLLLPFNERVYARTYMKIGDERYYTFAPTDAAMESIAGEGILTCQLPSDANAGKKFELKLSNLNIPEKPKAFKLEYGPLSLTGEVNENLMPILYKYPQMPIEDFAVSEVSHGLRKQLVSQVKTQLANMEGDAKVEALLNFMHNVFEYATDEDNHGFEKPYFIEETLYYPRNDCEDRAIFYTWFLWNALGREAQLITFPGHESATVVLDKPVDGTSYKFDGKTFYVSDPTYIGSKTGMVMPVYRGLKPEVDYTYRH